MVLSRCRPFAVCYRLLPCAFESLSQVFLLLGCRSNIVRSIVSLLFFFVLVRESFVYFCAKGCRSLGEHSEIGMFGVTFTSMKCVTRPVTDALAFMKPLFVVNLRLLWALFPKKKVLLCVAWIGSHAFFMLCSIHCFYLTTVHISIWLVNRVVIYTNVSTTLHMSLFNWVVLVLSSEVMILCKKKKKPTK